VYATKLKFTFLYGTKLKFTFLYGTKVKFTFVRFILVVEMMRVYQDHGETVMCIGSSLKPQNTVSKTLNAIFM
jgi:hypothetical protein